MSRRSQREKEKRIYLGRLQALKAEVDRHETMTALEISNEAWAANMAMGNPHGLNRQDWLELRVHSRPKLVGGRHGR